MSPIEAAAHAWDEATDSERARMFRAMYAYLSVLDPVDLFIIELQNKETA